MLRKAVKLLVILSLGVALTLPFWRFANADLADDIKKLETTIDEKSKKIDALEAERKKYESLVRSKQQEAVSLNNEISIIESKVAQTEISLEKLKLEIEKLEAEIDYLEINISEKEAKLERQKAYLSGLLKEINFQDELNDVNILLWYENFSEYFEHVSSYQSLHEDLQLTIDTIYLEKTQLEEEKVSLEEKNKQLGEQQIALEQEQHKLEEELLVKEFYLEEIKNSEEKFNQLLRTARDSESSMDSELKSLENSLRAKLKEKQEAESKKATTQQDQGLSFLNQSAILRWPCAPNKGVSAYFHDQDYPYRRFFEHSGIDIRLSQGSPVYAAESGYVAKAKDNGLGYNYIMVIHGDNLSSVYGHVSRIDVIAGQYVKKGDVIGLSGGAPGTPGAGQFSTGAHLHFEVRLNGIPVDPLIYLP
ncbi:MAG TPA: peptidoglycan DD-metalloendopeptidase family protein [bacterium]|nr:peptidoglycan DD-metalloendopeptidase family protein [bacterium]